jgi:hypothetical protein
MKNLYKPVFSGVILAGSALIMSACATVDGTAASAAEPAETVKAEAMSSEHTASKTGMSDMKAECMAMHEKMKAKMAEGGMMGHGKMGDGMGMKGHEMSAEQKSEMHAKHMKCMEMMPEMKAQMHEHMQAHCAVKHEGGMTEQCKMMQHGTMSSEGESK